MPHAKTQKTGGKKRRSHHALGMTSIVQCSSCGATMKPHVACSACGQYKGRKVASPEKRAARRAKRLKKIS